MKHCRLMMLLIDVHYSTARWSSDRKWKTVSVDPSGTVATKTDKDGKCGYIQTAEAVSKGVHTW